MWHYWKQQRRLKNFELIGIKVELPIIVRVDNVGVIFISENVTKKSKNKAC